jgi:CRP/FNR family transcriptional regulator, cyclic AMP receptor protein
MNFEFFPGLKASTHALLNSHARARKLPRGFVLTKEGELGDDVFFLRTGELAVWRAGRLITLLEGPRVVGLSSSLDAQPRTASLEVLRDAELIGVRGDVFRQLVAEHSDLSAAVITALSNELREAWQAQERDRASLDDFFESPSARLVPGPYTADVELRTFVMQDDASRLRGLLPPGCTPLPGLEETWVLVLSHFRDVHSTRVGQQRSFSYREVTPFVPCLGPDSQPGLFCPELYPDNYLAILLGRELYGFPKRMGQVHLGPTHVTVAAGHHLVLRAGWSGERAGDAALVGAHLASMITPLPALVTKAAGTLFGLFTHRSSQPLWPTVSVLVRKQIPQASSVYDERALHIDELVRVPFVLENVSAFAVLDDPEVQFFQQDFLVGGQARIAFKQDLRFTFGAGTVLHDYRSSAAPPPSILSRLARRWAR